MSSEIFRDRSEGVNARRLELLRRRRDEFVLMPHAIRRVYVARRARSAASIAVWLMGAATLVCALSPKLAAYVTRGMPGINPALLSTLVIGMWVLGIVAYFIARARCEHHFQVAMSKTVLPSENPDEDVERLSHEHPDEVARGMAHRLEVRSSAWPVAAAAMLLPMTLLYVLYGVKSGGWPAIADYEQSIARNAGKLVVLALSGSFAGVLMTHRALRQPAMATVALFATVVGGVVATLMGWWVGALAIVTASIGFVARKLRRERTMLETDDPAAGSEMFTWKGFITSVTSTLEAVGSKLNKRQGRIALIAGIAAVATLGFMTGRRTHGQPMKPKAAAAQVMPQQLFVNKESGSSFKITPSGNAWRVDITLTNDEPIQIRMPGIDEVPSGWEAKIDVRTDSTPSLSVSTLLAREGAEQLDLGDVSASGIWLDDGTTKSLITTACGSRMPLGIAVKGQPGSYIIYVTPVLEPAGCEPGVTPVLEPAGR